jgi:hypothetical protein
LSFLVFQAGGILDFVVRWSDPMRGLMCGLVHAVFSSIFWLFSILPLTVSLRALCLKKRMGRYFLAVVLAPSASLLVAVLVGFLADPPTVKHRFQKFAKAVLPENVQGLHHSFTGGGLADHGDEYYFQTTPDQVDRLVKEMGLVENELDPTLPALPQVTLAGVPDLHQWRNARRYERNNQPVGWFTVMITDATKTKVYISICCI